MGSTSTVTTWVHQGAVWGGEQPIRQTGIFRIPSLRRNKLPEYGARAEGSDGIYNAGISSSFQLPGPAALPSPLPGVTRTAMRHGRLFPALLPARQLQHKSAAARIFKGVCDVGNPFASDMTKYDMNFGVGFFIEPSGKYFPVLFESDTYGGLNTRVASASFSRTLSKVASLFMTASATRQVDTTYSFFIGLNFDFDKGIRGAAQYSRTGSANTETLQLQKTSPWEKVLHTASVNRNDTETTSINSFTLPPV